MQKKVLMNVTEETTLLTSVEIADSFFTRLRGLLGRKALNEGAGLAIKPCNSVHCFFMKFPIDVVFVDQHHQVCHIIPNMQPWKVSPIIKNAKYVIEAASFTVSKKVGVGDEVRLLDARIQD